MYEDTGVWRCCATHSQNLAIYTDEKTLHAQATFTTVEKGRGITVLNG
jgi:hypothetical protein